MQPESMAVALGYTACGGNMGTMLSLHPVGLDSILTQLAMPEPGDVGMKLLAS